MLLQAAWERSKKNNVIIVIIGVKHALVDFKAHQALNTQSITS